MRLSKKGEYALRSLINLGIAAEVKRSLVQVAELAENEQLPVKFLEQIMQALKEAGFVESARGKFGGYRLAKPARQIPIGQVIRLIDGPLAPIGCVSQSAYEKCTCPDEVHCGLRMLMLRHLVEEQDGVYRANPNEAVLLAYYANAIEPLVAAVAAPGSAAVGQAA